MIYTAISCFLAIVITMTAVLLLYRSGKEVGAMQERERIAGGLEVWARSVQRDNPEAAAAVFSLLRGLERDASGCCLEERVPL